VKKVLFLDSVHPILEEKLTALGYQCDFDFASSKQEIENKIPDYFGVVIRSRFPLDNTFFEAATNLKFVARSGAGLENIDMAYAAEKCVKVFNSPEGNMDAVGEHAIGMLLMLFNKLKQGDNQVREGLWDREGNRGLELSGKTIGIVGYGNMGKSFAKKLSGFDVKVIAYDKYKKGFSDQFCKEVSEEELFQQTDVLSIHLPLSEETHHFVNEAYIAKIKKPFYLINTARGNNVCLDSLVKAIKSEKTLGACLDVLEYETKAFDTISRSGLPESFKFLRASEKVIFSPHVAGWTTESYIKLSSYLAGKIEKEFG
jgi:D-3-phosphoglycerate dehydrogenase